MSARRASTQTKQSKQRALLEALGAVATALPVAIAPQLATLATRAPQEPSVGDGAGGAQGETWSYEIKFDGYRMLARVQSGDVRLLTRNGHDWTARMPGVVAAFATLPPEVETAWIDGEVVALGADGLPHFNALQNAFDARQTSATDIVEYFAFDLLYLNGFDLRGVALRERRRLLRDLVERTDDERLHFSEDFPHRGEDVLASACKLKLEGVIAKRADSVYRSGRSTEWLKLKCLRRQEFVVGGFTTVLGAEKGVRALALGVYDEQGILRHAGSVKASLKAAALRKLDERLQTLSGGKCPFAKPPKAEKDRQMHWVEPEMVVEVSFLTWEPGLGIRHGQLQGVREDKPARSIHREEATDPPLASPRKAPQPSPKTTRAAR